MTAEKMVVWLASDSTVTVAYDVQTQEHRFIGSQGRRCSYPSPRMLKKRLALSEELGVRGVACWEGGQGMAAFANLF